ncbi:MAG: nucleotidyltransferase domain-containing protein [Clostridium celatum]|uniref:type VII toxin-antitoxin system MntA family adenylyltransferase antitoxin n=1 Tax=Clostridium sp. TaxID=1506 RepID=UPI0026342C18|nr:nucleotidyltransferase domain-containing protein [Clostridium sp.]MDU5262463.1 nucleotidyltransferase domain-containing protein [Clostridium celatum]
MMNNNEITKVIHETFTRDDIDACYIFGSFLTNRFTEESDIDIAILGSIELEDRLYIEGILEEKLGRAIDLVNIEELPKNMQLQIISRNKKVIFKDNENTDRYLYELNKWYKEEYPFWVKMQREIGYEI